MIAVVFWTALAFVLYAYLGYPLALIGLSLFRNRPVKKAHITPAVSFIIAAYNEEKRIEDKISNTLRQDYPKDRFEIIIASDCSSDRTDDIVRSYADHGVKLVRAQERRGKEHAQKLAVAAAAGEVLIFSDAATVLDPRGVSAIASNFADRTVGCVSSVDRFIDADGKISGEGAYVRYEMFLRKLESRVNTLVGLSGSFFAARREVCREWAADLQSDFNTLLNSVKLGLRGVSDPESVGYYKNIADEKKEYDRKVRTVLRGISVFMKSLALLNPFTYGLFSWQLFSHKLCRWLVPFAMIAALLSNIALISTSTNSSLYSCTLTLQVIFYLLAGLGVFAARLTSTAAVTSILRLPTFFVLVNLSIMSAWIRYMKGDRLVAWEPSKR